MKTSLLLLETGNGLERSQGVSEPAGEWHSCAAGQGLPGWGCAVAKWEQGTSWVVKMGVSSLLACPSAGESMFPRGNLHRRSQLPN